VLVEGVLDTLRGRFDVTLEEVNPVRETVSFKLPRALTSASP
jgi:4-hydroxy-3-methylbut-2-enyl diphosphate reductase